MDNSIDRIVKASDYPLSIVIVGVGTADFTDMVIPFNHFIILDTVS